MPKPPPAAESLQTSDGQQRGARRRRSLLSGKMVHSEGAFSADCAIRDLSDKGARVRCDREIVHSGPLFLINLKDGLAYEGRMAWHRPPEYGMIFSAIYALDAVANPRLEFLRTLWLSSRSR